MTRYIVEVARGCRIDNPPEGFSLVKVMGRMRYSDLWWAEDADAPPELEGRFVEPVFARKADGTVKIIDRRIRDAS